MVTRIGNRRNNTLNGTSEEDNIFGLGGNDTLRGRGDSDRLYGGNGNDLLYGGGDGDLLNGGKGRDRLYGDAGNDKLFGSSGNDLLYGGAGRDSLYGADGVDQLYGGSGNDVHYGGAGNDIIDGGTGHDTLHGDGDDDELDGGSGNDFLYGGTGNDLFIGAVGNDTFYGGDGTRDTVDYSARTDAITALGVVGTLDTFVSFSFNPGPEQTNPDERDVLFGVEDFIGSNYTDYVSGTADINKMYGGASTDGLYGGAAADELFGGTGNDILRGDAGADQLTGGTEADEFEYLAVSDSGVGAGNRDIILDFNQTEGDFIDVSEIDSNQTGPAQTAWTFIGTSDFAVFTTIGEIRYFVDGSRTIIQFDLAQDDDSGERVDFEIELAGVFTLTSADFDGLT